MKMSHCPPTISVFLYRGLEVPPGWDLDPLGQPSASLALVLGQQGSLGLSSTQGFCLHSRKWVLDAGTRGCGGEAEADSHLPLPFCSECNSNRDSVLSYQREK